MKSSDFIPTNSLNKPIRNYNNFKSWFKNSVVVDTMNRPLVVYHGTSNDFDEFSLEFRDEDTSYDQYGPGFYTVNTPDTSSAYTSIDGGNIIPLYVSIQKPLYENSAIFNYNIVKQLITKSPNFDDMIYNYGDVDYEGMPKVLNKAVNSYLVFEDVIRQMNTIINDFWVGTTSTKFLSLVNSLTGYDGVVVTINKYTKYYIAWHPNQLKSAIGNNGDYSSSNSIMKEYNL